MEVLKIIRDADIGVAGPIPAAYRERIAARAVVFDANGEIALQHMTKQDYHKLPGGGVEEGESVEAGLARELAEEIGCTVGNVRELGIIEEFRDERELHHISYCFAADVTGEKSAPNPDEGEVAAGAEAVWLGLEDAIRTLEEEGARVGEYSAKFTSLRDLTLLKEARKTRGG